MIQPTLTVALNVLMGEQTYSTLSVLDATQAAQLAALPTDELPGFLVEQVLSALLENHPDFAQLREQRGEGASTDDLIRRHQLVIERFPANLVDVVLIAPGLIRGLA